jgi:hypothetical protein
MREKPRRLPKPSSGTSVPRTARCPSPLRQQCLAAGVAIVSALIALLEAGLADDQAAPEAALFHAVDLLGALGDPLAVPILLRCLEHDDLFDGMAPPAAAALCTLGPAALEGCLPAYATTTDEAFRDRLAGVTSRCGVHDERLYACLIETLQRTPELGANYLAEYGEARALDVLAYTFDTLPLQDEESPLANHVFIELRAAIEDLWGQLTAAQHRKFEAADAARRRLVAQMHWDRGPPAAPPWRTPPQATSVAGPRPPPPRGHANSDGMPPVGVGVARSIRSVISRSNGARENIGIASAPQIETILPWLLHIRGIGVVGQPPLGKPGTDMVQSTWTGAEA